ncbi:MAG: GGDEF domain-containing protein [Firmicutes bacterium]|nr:GGDEF domain-containing protein [Bacillota bacterium]
MLLNYAVLDEYYNIISGSPELFAYVGATNFMPFLKFIHEDDLERFKETLKIIDGSQEDTAKKDVIRICGKDEVYNWFVVETKKYERKINNKDAYRVELKDVNSMFDDFKDLQISNAELKKYISINEYILYSYDPAKDRVKMYFMEKNRENVLFDGSLDRFEERAISRGMVREDYVRSFRLLIGDIRSGKDEFKYEIVNSIINNGKEFKHSIVKGGAVYVGGKNVRVSGTVSRKGYENDLMTEKNMDITRYEIDSMTGLYNKTGIIQYTKDLMNSRHISDIVFAVFDIDNFKLVNDHLGHAYGDKVIIRTAEILSASVGERGEIGHFGGDEFVIVLTNISEFEEMRTYFRAIRSSIESEFSGVTGDVKITCSIGSAHYPTDAENYDSLFEIADKCLYLAKEYGKNRYIIYDERSREHILKNESIGENMSVRTSKQNYFTFTMTEMLFVKGRDAINDVLNRIAVEMGFDRIKIFTGENMSPEYYWGKIEESDADGMYIFEENYLDIFGDKHLRIIPTIEAFAEKFPEVYNELKEQNVHSMIQYLIKKQGKVVGMISYELIERGVYLSENQKNCLMIVSQLIAQIIASSMENSDAKSDEEIIKNMNYESAGSKIAVKTQQYG